MRIVFLSIFLLLAACDQGQSTSKAQPDTDYPAATSFTLSTPAGKNITVPQDHNGVDILFFWATWCPYCKQLMPHLQSIKDEYGDAVTIYAINIRDDGEPAQYIENNGFDFILLLEGDAVAKQYGIKGTPGLILIDGQAQQRFNMETLLAPAGKALEGLKHGQRAKRIAPWWAAQVRGEIDEVLSTEY